jgi:hypothetical protein
MNGNLGLLIARGSIVAAGGILAMVAVACGDSGDEDPAANGRVKATGGNTSTDPGPGTGGAPSVIPDPTTPTPDPTTPDPVKKPPDPGVGGAGPDPVGNAEPFTVGVIGDVNKTPFENMMKYGVTELGASAEVNPGDVYDDPGAYHAEMDAQIPDGMAWASMGNHDHSKAGPWDAWLAERHPKAGAECDGGPGFTKSTCKWKDLVVLAVGDGEYKSMGTYIPEALAALPAPWKMLCTHHQMDELAFNKSDGLPSWDGPIALAKATGSIWVHGHDHNYMRSRGLTLKSGVDLGASGGVNDVWDLEPDTPEEFELGEGSVVSILTGLGKGARSTGTQYDGWITSYYGDGPSRSNDVAGNDNPGSLGGEGKLFLTFNADGDPKKCKGEYYAIWSPTDGKLIDSFTYTIP